MKLKYPLTDTHTFSTEEILSAMDTDAVKGIRSVEAEKRTQEFGLNIYAAQKQKSLLWMLLVQFTSPIVYLLIFATAVTFYFQHYIEAFSILVVIVINALIGFLMELQARKSMKALKEMDVILSKVIRDEKVMEIPSEKIVPGEVILLEAGDVIPGDARLIESIELQCDESSLTGESLPSEKHTDKLPKETVLGDQSNRVFKGTSVTNGKGKAVVTGIAEQTQLGIITKLVESSKETETPLDKQIRILSKYLIWITLGFTAIFAITGFIQGKSWLLILETSIALAVAAFPEGLPIVSTVALSYGMLLMAKRNAVVKKLSSVETLGSTNVILTDKTGTLTENEVFVDTFAFDEDILKVSIKDNTLTWKNGALEKNIEAFQKVRLIGVLCNNAYIKKEDGPEELMGDPIEIALLNMADSSDTPTDTLKAPFERINEIPFSSETKMMATLHKSKEGFFVSAKGSGEHLLDKCSQLLTDSNPVDLSAKDREKILAQAEKMAADGLRVLAFAYREGDEIKSEDFLHSLVFAGLIGFIDPPRLDIKESISLCQKAGIKIVMITGDHPLTALNVAKKVGLVNETEENVITGSDIPPIKSLSEEWTRKILSTAVFARTTPKQKLEIVSIYQKGGNIVAMTGDGINDAPALKKADIGIAMGIRGTQVAKETADIVLKDDSFASIERAVAHGRAIFDNIRKFVVYLVSCNLSEILIVTSLGFIAPASTLLPLQILFLNMVTDIFPALALGLGKGDDALMKRPPQVAGSPIVSRKQWITVFSYSTLITLAVVAVVIYSKHAYSANHKIANNVAFVTLAFAQIFHIFNMSSKRSPFWVNEITKNKFAWIAILICCVILVLVYAIPQMREVLTLEKLSLELWIISLLAALSPLIFVQSYKMIWQWRKMV